MDSTRWDQIQELFHEAADLPRPQKHAFLQSACGENADLMADVLALLEEDARGSSMLDSDVAHMAHELLDGPHPSHNDIEGIWPLPNHPRARPRWHGRGLSR